MEGHNARRAKKSAAGPWGRAGRHEPGLGTGRGGDVTGLA
jgi:hypothetical protein